MLQLVFKIIVPVILLVGITNAQTNYIIPADTLTVTGTVKAGSIVTPSYVIGSDLNMDSFDIKSVTEIQFTGGIGTQGTLFWNADEETLDLIQNGSILQLGQELYFHVRNNSGDTIYNGQPVMITGTIGGSGRITVARMNNISNTEPYYFLGVATEEILNNDDGKITFFGKVRGVQTDGINYGEVWLDGDLIYLSDTIIGGLTNVEPTAPRSKKPIGIVIHAHSSNGILFIRAIPNEGFHELHDVQFDTLKHQDIAVYDTTDLRWENIGITTIRDENIMERDSGNYVANINNPFIVFNTISSVGDTVVLPSVNSTNVNYTIKDLSNTAATRNITVIVEGGGTIDGDIAGAVINTNYGYIRVKYIKLGVYALN